MIDGLDHFKILFVKVFAVEVNTVFLLLPLWLISIILILINFLSFLYFFNHRKRRMGCLAGMESLLKDVWRGRNESQT